MFDPVDPVPDPVDPVLEPIEPVGPIEPDFEPLSACRPSGREEVAQGRYREWVQEKFTEKYIDTSASVGLGKVRLARGMSQLTLWASLAKSLDSTKSLSWRFWSRLLIQKASRPTG